MAFCKSCGSPLEGAGKFCVRCGQPVNGPEVMNPEAAVAATYGPPAAHTPPTAPGPAYAPPSYPPATWAPPRPARNWKWLWIGLAALVAVAAIAAVLVFVVFKGGDGAATAPEKTVERLLTAMENKDLDASST